MKKDAEHLVRCISNLKSGCPGSLMPLVLRVVLECPHRRLVIRYRLRKSEGIGLPALIRRFGLKFPEALKSFKGQAAVFNRAEDFTTRLCSV